MKRVTCIQHSAIGAGKVVLALATTALTLGIALPALGEAPIQEDSVAIQNNIRQLVLLNECHSCDLRGAVLHEAHLIGADLRNANLQGADFTGSNLEGADFEEADLTHANLTDTLLANANLSNARLDNVNFSKARLYSVEVSGASMRNLNLTDAQISNTPISIGGGEPTLEEEYPAQVVPFESTAPPWAVPNPVEPYEVPLPVLKPQRHR